MNFRPVTPRTLHRQRIRVAAKDNAFRELMIGIIQGKISRTK